MTCYEVVYEVTRANGPAVEIRMTTYDAEEAVEILANCDALGYIASMREFEVEE